MNELERNFLGFRKLPPRFIGVVMPLILSGIMSCVISMVSMFRHIGWAEGFVGLWLTSWLTSWLIAFPTVLLMLPLARKVTFAFVRQPGR